MFYYLFLEIRRFVWNWGLLWSQNLAVEKVNFTLQVQISDQLRPLEDCVSFFYRFSAFFSRSAMLRLTNWNIFGAFHSTKNSEISDPKLNGTVKIPSKVFENLGIRFECTLFDGISGIIENFVFHSQKMSGLVSLSSVGDRTIRFPVCHTPKEQQYLFFWQNCGPPRWIASWIPPSVLYFLCQ